jgi:hypothetical protein
MAKPVALIDDGKISGLVGTNNNDVLTWNSSTQAWESQAGGGGGGSDWNLTGNAGTSPGTNYVGTSDSQQLQIRTNNLEAIRVDTAQQVGVNAAGVTLTHAFEVHGSTHFNPTGGSTTDIGNLANGGDVAIYAHQSNKNVTLQASAVNLQTSGAGATTIGNTANGGAINIRTAKAEALTVTPGSLSLTCATQSTAGVSGGNVTIAAGYSDFVNGGNVTISGGGGPTAGAISLLAGDGNTSGVNGGAITLTSGDGYAAGTTSASGDVTIQTGAGGGTSIAGSISILGGTGYNTAASEATGNITIRAGQNTYGQASRTSGTVTIQGGCDLTGASATIAGYVRIRGGDMSNATGGNTAGLVEIRGGNNTATGVSGSNGGNVSITGGSGRLGGQVTITAGQSSTSSNAGYVLIRGSTAGSANSNAILGGVAIQGGRSSSGFTVNVGASTTDYVNIGNDDANNTYYGCPVIVGGMLAFTPTDQTVTAGADFQPLTSYLRISSAGALSVSGNFGGLASYPDGAYLLIRNVGAFTITIPATGSIRTLTNGAKALAVGGTITVQYDSTIGAWYECATVLNAS